MKKIKYFLTAFTAFLLVGVVGVAADEVFSEEYKVLTSSNNLTIDFMYSEIDEIGNMSNILNKHLSSISDGSNIFSVESCNEDSTLCTISLSSIESHTLNITYNEVFSNDFKTLTSNNNLTVETKFHSDIYKEESIRSYLSSFNTNNYYFYYNNCNEDYSSCEITLHNNTNSNTEKHVINLSYTEVYSNLFSAFAPNNKIVVPYYSVNIVKNVALSNFLESNSTSINIYSYNNCNDDYTKCLISVYDINLNTIEEHLVSITYEEKISDDFKKILTSGKLVVKDSSLSTDKTSIISNALSMYFSVDGSSCNSDYTKCMVTMYGSNPESHYVDIVYNEVFSDNYKKLSSDGNIVITSSTVGSKNDLVSSYVNNLQFEGLYFYVSQCNEDTSKCEVRMSQSNPYLSEIHVVNIKYDEKISDLFKGIIIDGNIVVDSIKPSNDIEYDFFMQSYLNKFNTSNVNYSIGMCNEDYSYCDVSAYVYSENSDYLETHKVKVTYAELDKNKQTQVNKVLENVSEEEKFVVEDLENINFIVNSGYLDYEKRFNVEFSFINYSSELKKLLGNKNISASLDARAGSLAIFVQENYGGYILSYDGVSYGLFEGGAVRKNVIYIPNDTQETRDAYIKAAQDRINEYLGNNKVKIEYAGKLSENVDSDHDLLELNGLKDEYYVLTHEDYDGFEEYFVIYKDSSKMQKIETQTTSDIMTDISISMSNSSIPLDTSIKVNEIKENTQEYSDITNKLKDYELDNARVYDLKLYSSSANSYITKLDDGTFKVSIPIPEDLKDKDFVVYYVQEDGKVKPYEVVVEGNYATFITDHFSIYTLSLAKTINNEPSTPVEPSVPVEPSENNPNTYDGVVTYLVLGIISIVGIIGLFAYKKKMQ